MEWSMVFCQGTIGLDGFSMVFYRRNIAIDGFSMVTVYLVFWPWMTGMG